MANPFSKKWQIIMEVKEAIKERRSIRRYKNLPISKEIEDELIEALILAPSAGNLESRKFYFVKNQEVKEKLSGAALNQDFIAKAPLVIVGCIDKNIGLRYGKRGETLYAICDVSASIQNMMLLATSLGLGTVWIGAFDEREVEKILNLSQNLRPITIVPVGWPAEKPFPPERKRKEEVIEEVE